MTKENNKILGKNLADARNRHGYSMQDIADFIGVRRQYIHKIESGKDVSPLTDDNINIISERLGVSPEYFFEERYISISSEKLHFRSVSIPNYIKERAKIYVEDVISVCSFVKDYISPLGLDFPKFDLDEKIHTDSIDTNSLCKNELERVSLEVREYLGLGFGPISNMVRVLETNGIIVTSKKDISDKVDAFCNDDYFPVVVRNENKSAVRCRFDLAHELGHLILHKGINNDVLENPFIEKQANYFASCFLLPRISFIKEFPPIIKGRIPWEKLLNIKYRWRVSLAALIKRAFDLELIKESIYRKAFILLTNKGWRTKEPGDSIYDQNYIEMEKPEVIRNAITIVSNTHIDMLPKMKSALNLSKELIKDILGMHELEDKQFELSVPSLHVVK